MRVAYVLGRFPSLTETFILDELLWLQRQGVEVEILSLSRPKSEPIHERSRQLLSNVSYASGSSARTLFSIFYFALRSPRRLVKAISKALQYTFREPKMLLMTLWVFPRSVHLAYLALGREVDLVHAHFLTIPSIAASTVSKLLGVGLTVQPHAVGLFSRNQKSVRRQLEDASRVVTISGFHRSYIADLCPNIDPETIGVVRCGIESDQFQQISSRQMGEFLQILSVGRLVEKKGHGDLIDACALLASRGVEFRCEIVGSGPLEMELRNEIERHGLEEVVTLVGALDQKEILVRYQSSDVFALACVVARNGDRDGVPVSLMEAMACELPVVTTSIAGIPDLVEDEVTGLIVSPRDAESLADALEWVCHNPAPARDLGQRGRRHVLEEYEVSRNAGHMASFFREVLESQSQ